MKNIHAVVFDFDGLMFNTQQLYVQVGHELLRRRGREFSRDLLDRMLGRTARDALQIMIDAHGLAVNVTDLVREAEELIGRMIESQLAPKPGLFDLLSVLRRVGYPLAIATSSGRGLVERVLGRFNLGAVFREVLGAEDVVHGKPHPEIYTTAALRLQLAPVELLVFEDSGTGCAAAVAAGANVIAVPDEHSLNDDFKGSLLVAESLRDPAIYSLLGLDAAPS